MNIKLAFTVADASDMVHAGGEVSRVTRIVDCEVPDCIAEVLKNRRESANPRYCYQSLSISVVEEPEGV